MVIYTHTFVPYRKASRMNASPYVMSIRAWREIAKHITEEDVRDLEKLDDTEIPGVLMGLLVAADITPDEAEDLLVRVGFFEAETV